MNLETETLKSPTHSTGVPAVANPGPLSVKMPVCVPAAAELDTLSVTQKRRAPTPLFVGSTFKSGVAKVKLKPPPGVG